MLLLDRKQLLCCMLDKYVLIHDQQEHLHSESHAISIGIEGNKTRQVYFEGDSEKLKDSAKHLVYANVLCHQSLLAVWLTLK